MFDIITKKDIGEELAALADLYPQAHQTLHIAAGMIKDFGEWYVDGLDEIDALKCEVKELKLKLSARDGE